MRIKSVTVVEQKSRLLGQGTALERSILSGLSSNREFYSNQEEQESSNLQKTHTILLTVPQRLFRKGSATDIWAVSDAGEFVPQQYLH